MLANESLNPNFRPRGVLPLNINVFLLLKDSQNNCTYGLYNRTTIFRGWLLVSTYNKGHKIKLLPFTPPPKKWCCY